MRAYRRWSIGILILVMTLILVACSAVIINKTYILGGIDGLEIRDHIRIFMNDGEMKKIEEDPTQTVIKK